jgi:hypothetical protein
MLRSTRLTLQAIEYDWTLILMECYGDGLGMFVWIRSEGHRNAKLVPFFCRCIVASSSRPGVFDGNVQKNHVSCEGHCAIPSQIWTLQKQWERVERTEG